MIVAFVTTAGLLLFNPRGCIARMAGDFRGPRPANGVWNLIAAAGATAAPECIAKKWAPVFRKRCTTTNSEAHMRFDFINTHVGLTVLAAAGLVAGSGV